MRRPAATLAVAVLGLFGLGAGPPLVAIHGSLGGFRSWGPVMGPLSRRNRLIE